MFDTIIRLYVTVWFFSVAAAVCPPRTKSNTTVEIRQDSDIPALKDCGSADQFPYEIDIVGGGLINPVIPWVKSLPQYVGVSLEDANNLQSCVFPDLEEALGGVYISNLKSYTDPNTFPKLKKAGSFEMIALPSLKSVVNLENLVDVGDFRMFGNGYIPGLNVNLNSSDGVIQIRDNPSLKSVMSMSKATYRVDFKNNNKQAKLNFPGLQTVKYNLSFSDVNVFSAPKLAEIAQDFGITGLSGTLDLPLLTSIGRSKNEPGFTMQYLIITDSSFTNLSLASLEQVGGVRISNVTANYIGFPKLQDVGLSFIVTNSSIDHLYIPQNSSFSTKLHIENSNIAPAKPTDTSESTPDQGGSTSPNDNTDHVNHANPAIVGGVIGGCVAAAIIIGIIIYVIRQKRKRSQSNETNHHQQHAVEDIRARLQSPTISAPSTVDPDDHTIISDTTESYPQSWVMAQSRIGDRGRW